MFRIGMMLRAAIVVMLAAGLAACAASGSGAAYDIRGTVTQLAASETEGERLGTLLIEAEEGSTGEYGKASVSVTSKTRIYLVQGDTMTRGQFSDLKEGSRVEAVFTGPVAESYPVQATAGEIRILAE